MAVLARSRKLRQAAPTRTLSAMTGRSSAAARPTGPPAGPNGSLAHGSSWPGVKPSDAAQNRVRSATRWMHSRSLPSAAPSADKISDRLERRVGAHQPVGQPVQPGELAAGGGVDLLAGQQRDHVVGMRVGRAQVGHDPALAQHHDAVGEPEHLVDVVAGEQDRGALLAQAHDQLFDLGRFLDARATAVGSSRASSRGLRPMARATATSCRWPPDSDADAARGVLQRDAQVCEQRRGRRVEAGLRQHEPLRFLAEHDVGRDVQVVAQRQVLPDHGDALLRRAARIRRHPLAAEVDLAARRDRRRRRYSAPGVVLPAPFSPARATSSPLRTLRLMSYRARSRP